MGTFSYYYTKPISNDRDYGTTYCAGMIYFHDFNKVLAISLPSGRNFTNAPAASVLFTKVMMNIVDTTRDEYHKYFLKGARASL